MALASLWLHICFKKKCWLIDMFQRWTLSSKTSNKNGIGTWRESNLWRKSNRSFSYYLRAKRISVMFESLCFISSYYIDSIMHVYGKFCCSDNLSSPQREVIQLTSSVLLWGSHCFAYPPMFLMTETKQDSPWTNYFSFLIGSTAWLLVWAYGYN